MNQMLNIDVFGLPPKEDPTSYPGKRPKTSYIFCTDYIIPISLNPSRFENSSINGDNLEDYFKCGTPLHDRYMIVGYGSNASPPQLKCKYRDRKSIFPVFKGTLANMDVVYSNKQTSYGSIPATITDSPGTTVEAWATILDKKQLSIMDKTEGRGKSYFLAKIPGELCLENGEYFSPVLSYISMAGVLRSDGNPIRLKTIQADGKKFKEYTQKEIFTECTTGMIKILNRGSNFGIKFEVIPCNADIPTISEMKRHS